MKQVVMMLEVDSIWTADTQQHNFRSILEAMARPGKVNPLEYKKHESNSIKAVLATILDGEVTFSDHDQLLDEDDWLLLQAIKSATNKADYILCDGDKLPDFDPKLGTLESPENSATIIILVDSLLDGDVKMVLTGPGIQTRIECNLTGLDKQWLLKRAEWVCNFPLGVDLILVCRSGVMAIPRSATVEVL
jgi:alpha-D-ribose 1-methylphosphonate 5-triphosphate synthase subunit PhnH